MIIHLDIVVQRVVTITFSDRETEKRALLLSARPFFGPRPSFRRAPGAGGRLRSTGRSEHSIYGEGKDILRAAPGGDSRYCSLPSSMMAAMFQPNGSRKQSWK